jgi:hypothetical protein
MRAVKKDDEFREGNYMKYKVLILLGLAALLFGACAEPSPYQNRDSIIDLANTCAMCGATVEDDYFANSAFKSMGPGRY